MIRQQFPALVFLTGDIGFACFPLGIQRVEILLQPVLCALAGVYGAADSFHGLRFFRPRNRGPLHSVPVIRFATAFREK